MPLQQPLHIDLVLIGLTQDQKLTNRDLGSESQSRHTSVLVYNDGEIEPVAQTGLETHDTLVKNVISPGNTSSH